MSLPVRLAGYDGLLVVLVNVYKLINSQARNANYEQLVLPAKAVVAEMRRLYASDDAPAYLDVTAAGLLGEGPAAFTRLGLAASRASHHGDQLLLFPWAGAPAYIALVLALAAGGVEAQASTLALGVSARQRERLLETLARIADAPPPDGAGLAALAPNLQRAKFDGYLDRDLLARCYASERLDTAPLPGSASGLKADLVRL